MNYTHYLPNLPVCIFLSPTCRGVDSLLPQVLMAYCLASTVFAWVIHVVLSSQIEESKQESTNKSVELAMTSMRSVSDTVSLTMSLILFLTMSRPL